MRYAIVATTTYPNGDSGRMVRATTPDLADAYARMERSASAPRSSLNGETVTFSVTRDDYWLSPVEGVR